MKCPIWATDAEAIQAGDAKLITSARTGGDYRITGSAEVGLKNLSNEERARLTTWLVDQRLSGEKTPVIRDDVVEQALRRRPLSFSEKKRRLFVWISRACWRPGDTIEYRGFAGLIVNQTISAWIESAGDKETSVFMQLMKDEGLFETLTESRVRLTSKGFEMLESVETGGVATNQAFVAMWFNDQMSATYTDGIEPAMLDCGFRAFRVDHKETINKIDDEIIAEIRRSRFVVADFTCGSFDVQGVQRSEARGGVYFEAGFAQGLGIPVIWTVRSDCIQHVHFDIRQFAHILWNDPADLRTKLVNRVRAVIQGSN